MIIEAKPMISERNIEKSMQKNGSERQRKLYLWGKIEYVDVIDQGKIWEHQKKCEGKISKDT